MTDKEIVKKEKEEIGFFSVDDKASEMMSKDSESYVDDTKAEDMTLPMIKQLQALSSETQESSPEYVEGAKAGDFLNTLTKELLKGEVGFLFVPCAKRIVYIEWKDRKLGGGLVNHFGTDPTEYMNGKDNGNGGKMSERGHEIVKSYENYGYVVDPKTGICQQCFLSMTKTKVKKAKKWNSFMTALKDKKTGKQLPIYAGVYQVKSIPETNANGHFYNLDVKPMGYTLSLPLVGEEVYKEGKTFAEMVKGDKVKADYKQEETGFVDVTDERM